jgi:DNA-binding PucR family transcriptional regulator
MTHVASEIELVVDRRIAEVAAVMSPHELGEVMGDRLLAQIAEFRNSTDKDFREGLVMSCTGNLVAIQDMLVSGSQFEDIAPPPDAIAWAHALVHRGMSLAALLRAYRLGHELLQQSFEQATSEIDLEPDVRWRVLASATHRMFRYIDLICTQLVEDYEVEREQWLRGAAAAQAELVLAIVAGESVDPKEASATLSYDVAAPQLGFIVWRDARSRDGEPGRSLASVAKQLALEVGAVHTLVVPMGEHAAWAWATGGDLSAVPSRSAALSEHVRAAVGGVHAGLDGMYRTHHEARAARRVGDIFGARPGAILRYSTVGLTSLLSADPAQAVQFATSELGSELGADTDAMLRLRATILVYLDERRSPVRTARRLGIHQNTVHYRVKRAEELLGRPLEDRRLELEIALRLYNGLDGLRALSKAPQHHD